MRSIGFGQSIERSPVAISNSSHSLDVLAFGALRIVAVCLFLEPGESAPLEIAHLLIFHAIFM